jgi:NMD protein affecting ribosome stability and mRNA decay
MWCQDIINALSAGRRFMSKMETKLCRRCGENPVMFQRRICQDCFNVQQRVKKGKPAIKPARYCQYCGADITETQYRRTACDASECQEKWQQELLRRHQGVRSHRKPRKPNPRKCRMCGRPIDNGNYFFCSACYTNRIADSKRRIDGAWLYV